MQFSYSIPYQNDQFGSPGLQIQIWLWPWLRAGGYGTSFCKTFTQVIVIRNLDIVINADFIVIGESEKNIHFLTTLTSEKKFIVINAGLFCDRGPVAN